MAELQNKRQHRSFLSQLKEINLLDFNKFIFNHLILHLFKTETILPFIIAACVIGFSVIAQASRFIFIPQTSIAAYASFFIFTLIVSLITLIIYPVTIIFIVNFIGSYIKGTSGLKFTIKITMLVASFIAGIILFTNQNVAWSQKIQIVIIWIALYFVLSSLYLTHLTHNSIFKLSKIKIIFLVIVAITMSRPLMLIYLHMSEAINFTSINSQTYLPAGNCALLRNLDGNDKISDDNSIFNNKKYYLELPNNQGCYIYGNTIRYSFAYDFVLLVKKNIQPVISPKGIEYNEYVRLSCYAGNCYSQNHIFYKATEDLYAELLTQGAKLDHPL